MCGEWMVYGDDSDNGENNGESLILLLLFWEDTYLSCTLKLFEENEMLYILFFFSFGWVSCTPNSTVRHLSILPLVSLFLFSFEVPGTCPFLFSHIFLLLFSERSPFWNNVASGSNQNSSSIYFTGKNRNGIMFLSILSQIGVE